MDWFPVLFRDDPAGQLIESLRESFPLSADTHDHAVVTQAIRSLAQLQKHIDDLQALTTAKHCQACLAAGEPAVGDRSTVCSALGDAQLRRAITCYEHYRLQSDETPTGV